MLLPFARILPAALLLGCASLNPAGLLALSGFNPLGANPSDYTVAVAVPEALSLRDGDAVMSVSHMPDDPNVQEVFEEFPLSLSADAIGPRPPQEGEAIYVMKFTPAVAEDLRLVQHQIKESRQAGVTGKGSISVRVSGGCLTDQTAETLPITLWLRTRPDGKFVPLIVGRDLLDAFSEEEKAVLRSEQAACD